MMMATTEPLMVCPGCGALDFTTEPAVDEAGDPTGTLRVICAACGREVGELPPLPPGEEAEPEPEEGSLLPGPEEWPTPTEPEVEVI